MSAPFHFSASEIAALQDRATALWHQNLEPHPPTGDDFLDTVLAQHRANFDLWHVEDSARAPQAADHDLAEAKRAIDHFNQLRNDLMEQCDTKLLAALQTLRPDSASSEAELHSESPGLMIDRLSILSLKLYHTEEEIHRRDAPPGHAQRNQERLAVLQEQRDDLVVCLDRLWQQVIAGARRFKIYRQLKMYNDPTLNPAIYRSSS
jgi:Protein of unknown function (DUF4254)